MNIDALCRAGLLAILTSGAVVGGLLGGRRALANGEGASGFSKRDFRGNYGMFEIGNVEGLPFIETSRVSVDGAGGMVIDAIGNFGGVRALKVTLSCTYDIRPNGMGHMVCHDPTGEETSADLVLIDGGREVKLITTPSPAGYTSARLRRQ